MNVMAIARCTLSVSNSAMGLKVVVVIGSEVVVKLTELMVVAVGGFTCPRLFMKLLTTLAVIKLITEKVPVGNQTYERVIAPKKFGNFSPLIRLSSFKVLNYTKCLRLV